MYRMEEHNSSMVYYDDTGDNGASSAAQIQHQQFVENGSSPYDQSYEYMNNSNLYIQPYGVHIVSYISNALGVLAVILNIVFLVCMKWIPNSSSCYNCFIKNLAVCDIFGSLLFLVTQNWPEGPFALIMSEKGHTSVWLSGSPYIFRSIPWMFFTAYMLTLNCLTVSQYLASCKPHVYMHVQKHRNVTAVLGAVWLLASLQIIVPCCVLASLSSLPIQQAFLHLIVISKIEMVVWMVVYTLSTMLSILLNILVYFELKRLKNQRTRRASSSHDTRTPSTPTARQGSRRDGANSRAKNEAFITVFYLSVASIVCRLPLPLVGMLLITIIENVYGYTVMSWSLVSVVFLLYLVFVVDPVIYLLRMPDIRLLLRTFIKRLFTHREGRGRSAADIKLTKRHLSIMETGETVQSSLL
jgi:hypothetical protein